MSMLIVTQTITCRHENYCKMATSLLIGDFMRSENNFLIKNLHSVHLKTQHFYLHFFFRVKSKFC